MTTDPSTLLPRCTSTTCDAAIVWSLLDRFLLHRSGHAATPDDAQAVQRALAADGKRVIERIVDLLDATRADRALLALALASADDALETRRAALAALPRVARTGADLLQFAAFVEDTRGWGRSLRRAIADWYVSQPVERLAYQLIKYRRHGTWSHRDLLRLAHPETTDPARAALFAWACRGTDSATLPPIARAAAMLDRATDGITAAALIRAHDLPAEAVPTALRNDPAVQSALAAVDACRSNIG